MFFLTFVHSTYMLFCNPLLRLAACIQKLMIYSHNIHNSQYILHVYCTDHMRRKKKKKKEIQLRKFELKWKETDNSENNKVL